MEQVVILGLVVEVLLLLGFMMDFLKHGLSLLEAAVEEEVAPGMLVEIMEVMGEIGSQYLVVYQEIIMQEVVMVLVEVVIKVMMAAAEAAVAVVTVAV